MALELKTKQAWIKALRSGDYIQGKHSLLKEDGSRCCLGVLSAILSVELSSKESDGPLIHVARYEPIVEAGLSSADIDMLINLNDTGSRSFSEIADWIAVSL